MYVCMAVQYVSLYIDTELLTVPAVMNNAIMSLLHSSKGVHMFFDTFDFVLKIYQFYRNDSVHSHSIKGMYSYTLTIKLKQSFLFLA